MSNITIVQSKEKEETKKEIVDSLGILPDIKHLIDNSCYQNDKIKGDVFFIHSREQGELPSLILEIVEKAIKRE